MTNTTKITFKDLNDSQKQTITDKFLSDHPVTLQNAIVEYVLSKSFEDFKEAPFSHDDITNNDPTGQIKINGVWFEFYEQDVDRDNKISLYEHLESKCSEVLESLNNDLVDLELTEEEAESLEEKIEHWQEKLEGFEEIIAELNDMEFEDYPEIYQWLLCSDYLIRALEKKGQCTLDSQFWGRQVCGQSIVLDNVIQEISFDYFCDYGKKYLTQEQLKELL